MLLSLQKPFTFHDFRHGGATWTFRHGIPLQDMQAQGTWYIDLPSSAASLVDAFFVSTFLHDYFILGVWEPSICPASSMSHALL